MENLPTKDEIKAWLKRHKRSRAWLGESLFKKLPTINNWLSTNIDIPDDSRALIRRLMADDEAAEQRQAQQRLPQNQIFSLEVTLQQHRRYADAALKRGKTVEAWSIEELDAAAEAWERDPTSLRQYLRDPESHEPTSKLNEAQRRSLYPLSPRAEQVLRYLVNHAHEPDTTTALELLGKFLELPKPPKA